jgi:hypothetical protein
VTRGGRAPDRGAAGARPAGPARPGARGVPDARQPLAPGPGVLFTGDSIACVEGDAILGVFNVDRAAAIASVRKLAGLELDVACFGHGAPLVGGAGDRIRSLAERLRLATP